MQDSDGDDSSDPVGIGGSIATYIKEGGGYDVALSTWALSHGVPIPPTIFKRARIGFGRLIDGCFKYATNEIERRNAKADFNAQHQQKVVSALAGTGQTILLDADRNLSVAVARSFMNEHGLKLENRASVVQAALDDLCKNPPLVDNSPAADIGVDWLNQFAEIASLKSDPDMQILMGKILAGEIRKPGSFSPLSIAILATLTREVAKKFEALCSVSLQSGEEVFISTDAFPLFLQSGIPELQFSYQDLITLRSYQLLAIETGSSADVLAGKPVALFNNGKRFALSAQMPDSHPTVTQSRHINMALFSPMGSELSRLLAPVTPAWFEEKLQAIFVAPNWSIEKF